MLALRGPSGEVRPCERGLQIGRGVLGLVDPKLSRQHCELRQSAETQRWELAATGKGRLLLYRLGGPVDGHLQAIVELQPGDRICLGKKSGATRELHVIEADLAAHQFLEAAPRARRDPATGETRTQLEFVRLYGGWPGLEAWNAAETRLDPADFSEYTQAEFTETYGGTDEWDAAAPTEPPDESLSTEIIELLAAEHEPEPGPGPAPEPEPEPAPAPGPDPSATALGSELEVSEAVPTPSRRKGAWQWRVVHSSPVDIRDAASDSAQKVGSKRQGTLVDCYEVVGNWLRVSRDVPRWVRAWSSDGRAYLVCVRGSAPSSTEPEPAPAPEPAPTPGQRASVVAPGPTIMATQVVAGPGPDSTVVMSAAVAGTDNGVMVVQAVAVPAVNATADTNRTDSTSPGPGPALSSRPANCGATAGMSVVAASDVVEDDEMSWDEVTQCGWMLCRPGSGPYTLAESLLQSTWVQRASQTSKDSARYEFLQLLSVRECFSAPLQARYEEYKVRAPPVLEW